MEIRVRSSLKATFWFSVRDMVEGEGFDRMRGRSGWYEAFVGVPR